MYRIQGETQTYPTARECAVSHFNSNAVATLGLNQWMFVLTGETIYVERT